MTKRIFITIVLLSAAISASAQKKHAQVYLGAGYGIFSGDMYNAGGADFNIGIKYFATDYVFIDLTAQLGSSKGHKTQTINISKPAQPIYTSDRFEHTLAEYGIMLGPGYNLYNNGQSRLYVKAQAGYTWGTRIQGRLGCRLAPTRQCRHAVPAGIRGRMQSGVRLAKGGKRHVLGRQNERILHSRAYFRHPQRPDRRLLLE